MFETKKYYWLKLRRDFFKRHDTKIIEAMENGKDYLLFYLKLLVESIDHEGNLRFSDTVPYNDKMLSVITDTNIDIVRCAVKVFSELGMMDQMDDGTLFMKHVDSMIGGETSDALRMRSIRDVKKQILIEHEKSEQCSKVFKNRSPELELEKELEKDKKENFEIFWNQYPKKVSKSQAERTYNGLIKKGVLPDDILHCLKNYNKEIETTKKDLQYVKNPSTFLNNYADYEKHVTLSPTEPVKKKQLCRVCGSDNLGPGCCRDCGWDLVQTKETWLAWKAEEESEGKIK